MVEVDKGDGVSDIVLLKVIGLLVLGLGVTENVSEEEVLEDLELEVVTVVEEEGDEDRVSVSEGEFVAVLQGERVPVLVKLGEEEPVMVTLGEEEVEVLTV